MRRAFVVILTCISLLLCIASVWIWDRSEHVVDRITVTHETSVWVTSAVSHLWFSYVSVTSNDPDTTRFQWSLTTQFGEELWDEADPHHYFLGFATEAYPWSSLQATASDGMTVHQSGVQHMLGVPCWFFVALFSILPLTELKRWLRKRIRRSQSRCIVCGYDLRGTPDRCPECGTLALQET